MHKTLYKWIAAAAVICCLLSGFGGNSTETGGPDTSPDVSGAGDDLAGLFDDNSPTIEIGGFSYGWPDERDVFTYSGEPLEIPFYLTGFFPGDRASDLRGRDRPALLRCFSRWHKKGRSLYAGF